MKHFDYFAPTEIIFGAGRVTEAGALAARYGMVYWSLKSDRNLIR